MRSKQRILISGRAQGGGSFGRGALYHLLQNRIYRGEAVHKGVAYPGEHKAIVDEELWRAVQDRLAANRTIRRKSRIETGALLGGLIYDDRGNIMSPTYSIRRGNRYRYYISSALLHDRRPDAGSLARRSGGVTTTPERGPAHHSPRPRRDRRRGGRRRMRGREAARAPERRATSYPNGLRGGSKLPLARKAKARSYRSWQSRADGIRSRPACSKCSNASRARPSQQS